MNYDTSSEALFFVSTGAENHEGSINRTGLVTEEMFGSW